MRKRDRAAAALQRLAERIDGRTRIALDYAPAATLAPRYGWGTPPHAGLEDLFARSRDDYAATIREWSQFVPDLSRIALTKQPDDPLYWDNGYCSGLDGVAIYSLMRTLNPATYLEIGSGFSTLFADRARRDGDLRTSIVSIDPAPRTEVASVCDVAVRRPFESVDAAQLPSIVSGDLVFVDGSHRVFENSDATVVFLELLPSLPSGVTVAVDDVMLPYSYPPEWTERFYSEQYLVAAYLLGGSARLRPLLPNYYLSRAPLPEERALWSHPPLDAVNPQGTTMWFVTC